MGILGRGGTGTVYRAHELASGATVAIKIIPMVSPTLAAQVERELSLASAIHHPNIVAIRSIISSHHGPCCVMELVEGPTFSTLTKALAGQNAAMLALDRICTLAGLDRTQLRADLAAYAVPPAPWYRLVAAWMLDLCAAVQAAHAAGIVHRDIKPHNLLLAPDGTLKLTDFGAAAALDGSSLAARYGTPRYLPPERLADLAARGSIRTGDRRVDLWGIGVCMYELLTLRPAFDATTVADALRAVATMDPIQPRQVNWSVPPQLESCCMRCLRRDPNERYPEASALAADLAAYLAQPSGTSALASLGSLFKRFGQPGGRA
jgi:serine/threonine protein kinase